MGIIQRIFGYKSKIDLSHKLDNKNNGLNESQINYIVKIHICGNSERKRRVIDLLFKDNIKNEKLKSRGDNEFRTADFYWITKIYKDEELIDENFIKNMEDNIIMKDKADEDLKIKHHVMLYFGNDINLDLVLKKFSLVNLPRIIVVNDKEIEIKESNKKRYVKNIICNNMDDKELNKYIVSSLWELDCYFNEKGNQMYRYAPSNILKEMNSDNSFFSINILLTGMSRAGKSTFINLLSGKLIALETNEAQSVTLKFSEYYMYRDDNKKEHGGLKLIDTPGICDKDEVNSKTYEILNDYVKNEKKEIGKQLHFILFFFMENSPLGNSEKILKLLNDYDYPVFFIINKSFDDSDDGRSQSIQSTILFLRQNNCNNLAKPDNFIQVNIKKSKRLEFYGVDDIFAKLEKYINDKHFLDKSILDKMNKFQDDFRLSQIPESNKDINEVKNNINDFCNELTTKNLLFRKMNLENIKEHGRKITIDLVKNIILLSKLKNVFPEKINNFPIISFLQAYMIKEIGGGYGFDFSSVSFCFKKFDKDISKFKELNFISNGNEYESQINPNNNEIIQYNREYNRDELNNKINNMWKSSDQEVIERLVNRIHEITSKIDNGQRDEKEVNIDNIKSIADLCQKYFEEELDETNGLPFFIYFYNKNISLMEDIKYYSKKKDWEKDEIEIIKK